MLVMLIWAEQLRQAQRMEPRRAKLVADICVCSTALFLATHVEIVVVCTTCCNDLLCVVNKLQSFFVSGQLIAGMAHLGGLMIRCLHRSSRLITPSFRRVVCQCTCVCSLIESSKLLVGTRWSQEEVCTFDQISCR